MTQTLAVILPYLTLIAGPIGGGALGAWVFQRIRTAIPREGIAIQRARWYVRLLAWALYDPFGALLSALILSGIVSIGASVSIAALTGQDVLSAFDTAFAGMVGAVASQIAYRGGIKPQEPLP